MGYMPLTPFGRTVDAVLLKHQQAAADGSSMLSAVSKWDALRDLAAARKSYGLSDRDLSVLQALLGFLPGKEISPQPGVTVVHPSNRAICERLNGMPSSTMRRHMARLVDAGILIRRDSPNGKRYVRRYQGERVAYGFDLSPLAFRFAEFSDAAEARRAEEARIKQLRETVSLMRRDLLNLALCGAADRPELTVWDQFHDLAHLTARDLRRKLGADDLEALQARLATALTETNNLLEPVCAEDLGTSDTQIEHHYQNSKKDSFESEQTVTAAPAAATESKDETGYAENPAAERPVHSETPPQPPEAPAPSGPSLPLRLVLSACGEICGYADGAIRHWNDLLRAADTVRPMMGISATVWEDAKTAMGTAEAATVVAAMLERFSEIRSPSGYLRHLSAKAVSGRFTSAPMVLALTRRGAAA
ncbi:replication initiation protein (plasmid) [Leisingera aquaemixtae]|uniref:Replication initiation protein n=1 Tax=Leisingera aquaemixtae TaxID=1396826 RepID=A0ABY5WQS5_9RHOB|nr:plasmid replication protein RepC [Leisingera aquaemixtae]UWQ43893.1 replication initiation protein [Leisingera aquaemixtae]